MKPQQNIENIDIAKFRMVRNVECNRTPILQNIPNYKTSRFFFSKILLQIKGTTQWEGGIYASTVSSDPEAQLGGGLAPERGAPPPLKNKKKVWRISISQESGIIKPK